MSATLGMLPCPRSPHLTEEEHKNAGLVDWWCPVTGRWTCFALEAWVVLRRQFGEPMPVRRFCSRS